jgi:hypothetical protein
MCDLLGTLPEYCLTTDHTLIYEPSVKTIVKVPNDFGCPKNYEGGVFEHRKSSVSDSRKISRSSRSLECSAEDCNEICFGRTAFVRHAIQAHKISEDHSLFLANQQAEAKRAALKNHSDATQVCDTCQKEFSGTDARKELGRHVKFVHTYDHIFSNKVFKCNRCQKCFKLKHNLNTHMKNIHKTHILE